MKIDFIHLKQLNLVRLVLLFIVFYEGNINNLLKLYRSLIMYLHKQNHFL